MEEDHNQQDDPDNQEIRGSSGVGGSRWNPTKEQIALLEKMYTDGVRTPSADQIQQITARLTAYGHIEGKNVFYWFQNHKARQRQKQRQQRLAVANPQFVHHYQPLIVSPRHYPTNHNINVNHNPNKPIFPAPPSNYHPNPHGYLPNAAGTCNPYYYRVQQSNMGFYPVQPPYQHNPAPAGGRGNHLISTTACNRGSPGAMMKGVNNAIYHNSYYDNQNQQCGNVGARTLDLFPVHPTGILENKVRSTTSTYNSSSSSSPPSSSTESDNNIGNHQQQQQRLFDFFAGDHASSESD